MKRVPPQIPAAASRGRKPVAAKPPGSKTPTAADVELARLTKAPGHPVRAAILRYLIHNGECECGGIVDLLPLAQSTVSQHLKVLKEAGLLQGEVDGPHVCYCADPAAVRRLKQLIDAI